MTNNLDTIFLTRRQIAVFWNELDESYSIERMFEDYENVLITLKDKAGSVSFVYYKSQNKKTEEVAILDNDGEYVGFLWRNEKGKKGGTCVGEKGKRKTLQCLKMLEKSITYGYIELEVFNNENSSLQKLPLSEVEVKVVSLLNQGLDFETISSNLDLIPGKINKVKKNLKRKGFGELESIA